MNIKKYSLKTMCAALACTTVLSSMLAAYATNTTVYETPMDDSAEINSINALSDDSAGTDTSDSGWTTEENSFEDIKVTYQQSSSYAVTIPKTIALDTKKQAAYSVKVSGDIDANQRVYVAPVDGITDSENLDFYMKDLSGKKADVVATVTQNKVQWSSEDVANAYEETQNCVSAPDLTAGTWEGTFQVEIRLETEKAHEHNYVDGKCECGAIDPNHTHNYENGTCTICGEKDSYTVAPAEAYSNWDYTLDDVNDIITLNYYKGSETDVIVYANYPVDGKTYKTQLASNSGNGPYNAKYMFNGYQQVDCKNIETIKFSKNIDTSNVTDMNCMFYQCQSLTSLDVSNFDTSNVTNMLQMFYDCNLLTSLDVSNFDTSKVINIGAMFARCKSLTNLDLSNFNTSKVTNMQAMFQDCNCLTSLDVSNFDTSNVSSMVQTFLDCYALTSLDISSFDTRNVMYMQNMFDSCTNLKTIYVTNGKWSTSKAVANTFKDGSGKTINGTNNMFLKCGTSSVTYK